MGERLFARGSACVILAVFAASMAFAQSDDATSGPIHGIFEQYFEADSSHKGVNGELSYIRLDADLDHGVKLVGSYVQMQDDQCLDELYAEIDRGRDIFKLGRFRSDFGFSTWSDLYYTPFVGLPMIRGYDRDIVPGISLDREDRGAEWESYIGPIQWQLAFVDSSDEDWQIGPNIWDTGVGRVQVSAGPVLVGLNGFAKPSDQNGPSEQIVGLDLRWTGNRTEFRGEVDQGVGHQGATGYYADFLYRPPHLARTQVGVRYQGIHSITSYDTGAYGAEVLPGGWGPGWAPAPHYSTAQVLTFAARQFLGPHFTLSVNYGTGTNSPQSVGLLGWSAQLLASYRF